jgi:hypothetical protein
MYDGTACGSTSADRADSDSAHHLPGSILSGFVDAIINCHMPVKFPFVTAFICERALLDVENIVSAIRLVDIFNIPANAPTDPVIQFWLVASMKAVPVPEGEFRVGITLVRVSGERSKIALPNDPISLSTFEGDRSIPGGINIVVPLQIIARNMGTAHFEIDVDGEVVARVPFTTRRVPEQQIPQAASAVIPPTS